MYHFNNGTFGYGFRNGWAPEYKWSNTVTQAMETKQSYVEKVDNLYVGCGVYK